VRGFSSGVFPEYRDYLYYTTQDSKLKNVLSPRVPNVGARCGKQVIDNLLAERGLQYDDIARWVIHPGGERVIDAFQRALQLPTDSLAASRTVLLNYGNMSSASVVFVLEETLRNHRPRPGDLVMMCSFGAGFTAFAGLLEKP
jgi:alkylresorcinol/alkylpyrone synthase